MKLLHTGDWHLCSLQYGKRSRADAIYAAARQVGPLAKKLGVDGIIHPGDILDSSTIGSYPLAQLDALHDQLVELGLPMYTLTGNHDMDNPTWISRYSRPDNIGIVPVDNRIIEMPDGSRIVGFMTLSPAELFRRLDAGSWRDTDIALWHGGVAEFTGGKFGKYPTVKDITTRSPIKNWLLADIHVCRYLFPKQGGIIGYPGPVEMTDINEDPEKYAVSLEFDRGIYVPESLQQHRLVTTPVYTVPLCSDSDIDEAKKLLSHRAGEMKMIWFQFSDEYQSAMKDLYVFTSPKDVVREKNVTVRHVREIVESRADLVVDIREVADAESEGLPDEFRSAISAIVNKSTPAPVLLEKLTTKYETTFF